MTEISKLIDKGMALKQADILWPIFVKETADAGEFVWDQETPYVHILDIADGHHGQHTFDIACERFGVTPPSVDSDPDGYYMFQDEMLEKWSSDAVDYLGRGFEIVWFHDGSISLVYECIEEKQFVSFFGNDFANKNVAEVTTFDEYVNHGDYSKEDLLMIDGLDIGDMTRGSWQENHMIFRVSNRGAHDGEPA